MTRVIPMIAGTALLMIAAPARGEAPRLVSGGPRKGAERAALQAALAQVASRLDVCWGADGPTSVRVALAVGAGGQVTRARQVTAGAVAQCVAGVLAVQRLAPAAAAHEVTVELASRPGGGADGVQIDDDLRAHRARLQACGKDARGRVVVRFLVHPDGRLADPAIESTTVASPPVERCLLDTVRGLRVRARPGRKLLSFSLALDFAGAGAGAGAAAGSDDPLQPRKSGPLDGKVITGVIDAARPRIDECYARQARKQPELAGRVLVRATIRANGTTRNVAIKETTLASRPVEGCLVKVFESLRFPGEAGRAETRIQYPFQFARRP